MKLEVSYGGQCESCANAEYCTFPRIPGQLIRNCEEYCSRRPIRTTVETATNTRLVVQQKTVAAERTYKGLCAICDKYEACTFPRAEGVPVMFCEEYH